MARICEELFIANFYVSVIFEGLGVVFLVFIGGMMSLRVNIKEDFNIWETAFVYGVTLASIMQCLKEVSGSHVNPAISFASMLTRRISILRGILYMIFQCAGGILGAFILKQMATNAEWKEERIRTLVNREKISLHVAIGYEIIFTFMYAWTFFASQNSRQQFKGYGGPLAVGLIYAVSHLAIIGHTGCSLNPARSLGPDVVLATFEDSHWVYWIGPVLAASLAVLIYDLVSLNAKGSFRSRPRSCSTICCKPTMEETIRNLQLDSETEKHKVYRGDIIVRKPAEVSA